MIVSSRRQRLAAEIATFTRQYARKAHPRHDPNDRRYSRHVEQLVKRMDAEELDSLLRDDEDEAEDEDEALNADQP